MCRKLCKIKYIRSVSLIFKAMSRTPFRLRFLQKTSFLILCLSIALLGQQNPESSDNPPAQNQAQPPAETPAPPQSAAAPVDSNSYKVGPADVLNIRVWHELEFSGPVSVHTDGKITMPLIGDLAVGGKTPVQIEQVVAQALTKYVNKPLVSVTVQEVLSKRYYLDGEIIRAGEYPLITPTTVLEAISRAGGLREFASEKKIYILRGDKRIPFNYKDVTHGKHMEQNILLEPGDHVIVP